LAVGSIDRGAVGLLAALTAGAFAAGTLSCASAEALAPASARLQVAQGSAASPAASAASSAPISAPSGGVRTPQTAGAVLSGSFAVSITVLHGGAPLGQRAGQLIHRAYRFTPHCSGGGCESVTLLRGGASGTFSSTLRQNAEGHYVGSEAVHGLCDDGESFKAHDLISVSPTAVSGSRVEAIAGTLEVRLAGCVHGTEVSRLTGGLSGK